MVDSKELEEVLKEVRRLLRRVDAHLQPVPTLHPLNRAARRLGFGITKLRAEMKARRIHPTWAGGRWMVSESEIQRYSRPAPTPPPRAARRARSSPTRAPSASSVREEVDAFLRRR